MLPLLLLPRSIDASDVFSAVAFVVACGAAALVFAAPSDAVVCVSVANAAVAVVGVVAAAAFDAFAAFVAVAAADVAVAAADVAPAAAPAGRLV